ncbi:MAG TPA: hypothetical protein ENI92_02515, partial [Bacteroidetes bacterium]|nr:hypothetical protein [Bacteroidota bacterium]
MKRANAFLLPAVAAGLLLLPWAVRAQTEHFSFTVTDAGHSIVLVYAAVNEIPLAPGDEVGVFTSQGLCAGAVVWDEAPMGLTAWGDDPITPEVDGFAEGEPLELRIWDRSTGLEWIAELVYQEGPVTWTMDGITQLALNAVDEGLETGDPLPVVDVIHFGTVGPGRSWVRDAYIANVGEGTLALNDVDLGSLPLSLVSDLPLYIPPGEMGGIELAFDGSAAIDDSIVIQTNGGDVTFQVVANVHPDGEETHFAPPPQTGTSHSVLLDSVSFNYAPLLEGDEIAVFGADSGVLAGWAMKEAGNDALGIAVWGDDPTTQEVDGLSNGEEMQFVLWRRFEAVEDTATPELLVGGTQWSADAMTVLNLSVEDVAVVGEVERDLFDMDVNFPDTQVGRSSTRFKSIEETLGGWVWVLRWDGDPEGVFNSNEFWEPGFLPPGSTGHIPQFFAPQEPVAYAGSASTHFVTRAGGVTPSVEIMSWNAYGTGLAEQIYQPTPSDRNLSLIVTQVDLDGAWLHEGDEIGVLTPEGVVAGGALYNGVTPLGITVWGDDPTTPDVVEGFLEGERMIFRIWDSMRAVERWAMVS